jgi:acetyl-CoA C-acetyltransferase
MSPTTRWRLPVVAGAGQLTVPLERPSDGRAAGDLDTRPDPLALMADAVHRAAADLRGDVLGAITHVWVVPPLSLRHHDPAGLLAGRLGLSGVEARCGGMGGNVPQWLVGQAAEMVRAGLRPCVVVVGAEAMATRRAAQRAGVPLSWPEDGGFPTLWPPLEPDMGVHPVERAHGLSAATATYALIESTLAHRRGLDPEAHRRHLGTLMAPCSAVAAANPYAWFPRARAAEELVTVSPDNRMVCHPYPKYLNAVLDVDMAAAVLVCDAERAASFGLGTTEVAHVAGWAEATETWHVAARPDPSWTPALADAGRGALAAAGRGTGNRGTVDVDAVDLYACFPSALAVAAEALGVELGPGRPGTLTGALPYHGGPGSNYVTHAIANVLGAIRAGRVESALVHGNGYYLTKHAVGVYTTTPPPDDPEPAIRRAGTPGHRSAEPTADQPDEPDEPAAATRPVVEGPDGVEEAVVIGGTVPHGRDGSRQRGVVLLELPGGRRTVAWADEDLTDQLEAGRAVGSPVRVKRSPDAEDGAGHATPANLASAR